MHTLPNGTKRKHLGRHLCSLSQLNACNNATLTVHTSLSSEHCFIRSLQTFAAWNRVFCLPNTLLTSTRCHFNCVPCSFQWLLPNYCVKDIFFSAVDWSIPVTTVMFSVPFDNILWTLLLEQEISIFLNLLCTPQKALLQIHYTSADPQLLPQLTERGYSEGEPPQGSVNFWRAKACPSFQLDPRKAWPLSPEVWASR